MGHHFDRWDSKWHTILPRWDTKWDTNGHHSAKMGHKGTPMDIKMVSHVVMVKSWASRGVCTPFSEAGWLKDRVKVA